ncbi:MAG: hypothetical protein JSU86_03710 [Phycisphaerales bacterium]|nr:MAG: hypothetical protein JSU86_03710 [Phycisphaerales bacterium]
MISNNHRINGWTACGIRRAVLPLVMCGLGLWVAGCGSFNPAFVNLLDPTGSLATIDRAPGHLVIGVVNNAEVDERLLAFLESAEGGNLVLTDAEKRLLRPRMRFRLRVTFTDGSFQTIEFIDGSRNLVDQNFDTQAFPDLNQNDLNSVVVLCDVASVELEPGTNIEVFIPVELTAFELVETTTPGGAISTSFEPRERIPPQFRALEIDETDADGNVLLQQNIGVRDVPSPTLDPICGSFIAVVVNGVLSVPFLDGVSNAPSYDRDDETTMASIGGRYEFLASVQ